MKYSRTGARFLSLALAAALLLPSLTGLAGAVDTPVALTAKMADNNAVSLNFIQDSSAGWKPATNQRLWLDLENNTVAVDDFQYTITSDKDGAVAAQRYSIDAYGYLTLNKGKSALAGETLTITANVDYYDGADVIWADNVVDTTKRLTYKDNATQSSSAGYYNYDYTISDTSSVTGTTNAPAQVSRTGTYGITTNPNTKNGAAGTTKNASGAALNTTGILTAWYYDPVEGGQPELTVDSDVQFGVNINAGVFDNAPNKFMLGLAALKHASGNPPKPDTNYAYRPSTSSASNGWASVPDGIGTRSEGWHKLQWVVDGSTGLTMYLDAENFDSAHQVYTDPSTKAITGVYFAGNKGYRDTTQAILQNRHFIDDITLIQQDATKKSSTITLHIPVDYTAPNGPAIEAQPTAVKAVENASASFTIEASTQSGTLSYQWYRSDNAEGTGGVALANGALVSGATDSTLTLSQVTAQQNGSYYYCQVSNGVAVKSAVVKLTVLGSGAKLATPVSPTIGEDGSVTFAYTYMGSLTFRFYVAKTGGETSTFEKTIVLNNSNWANTNLLTELRGLGAGAYTIAIQALGGDGALDSDVGDASLPVELSKLATPSAPVWVGSKVKWEAVASAKSYRVQLYANGVAQGSALVVDAPTTERALTLAGTPPYTATVTALANITTLCFDSDASPQSAARDESLHLAFDSAALNKNDTGRIYIEGPSNIGIESFTFQSGDTSKLLISPDGTITIPKNYTPPDAGETIEVTAKVTYYPQTIWSNPFEAPGGWAQNEGNVVFSAAGARTGRLGGDQSTAGGVGAWSPALGGVKGTVVFWYYDAYSALEQSEETYDSQTKFGMMLNNYQPFFGGVAYDVSDSQAAEKPNRQHYAARLNGTWTPTTIARSAGWHKFEFRVTSGGASLWIDGKDSGIANPGVTGIDNVIFTTNWGNQGGNKRYTNGQHFVDDVYVLAPDAKPTTSDLVISVKIAPKQYQILPEQTIFDLEEPADVSITVKPDLEDLQSIKLNGKTLTGSQYAVKGEVLTLKQSLFATLGDYTLLLTLAKGKTLTHTIQVIRREARAYYVNSLMGKDSNDGLTPDTAWRSLTRLNQAAPFHYNDRIYLEANSVWNNQQLVLSGDGRPGQEIKLTRYTVEGGVTKYGADCATSNRPTINGNGTVGTVPSYIVENNHNGNYKFSGAVELWNAGYWEISWLEVTNLGATSKNGNGRCGIMVMNEWAYKGDMTQQTQNFYDSRKDHVYITDCYVHDVNGLFQDVKDVNNVNGTKHSGGIIGFGYLSDFQVERCRISKVDIEGIRTTIFHPAGTQNAASYPADLETNTVFRNNFIDKLHGDAMVIAGGVGSLMEYNVATQLGRSYVAKADGSNYVPGEEPVHLSTAKNFAAIWFMGCKNSLAQFNECYDTQYKCDNDGEAWDIDMQSDNCVYQYNYSHHNSGGCVLFMNNGTSNNQFRYNLSVEDGSLYSRNGHTIFYVAAGSGSTGYPLMYNNIFTIANDVDKFIDGSGRTASNLNFQNNLVFARDGISNRPPLYNSNGKITGGQFTNNIFYPANLYTNFQAKLGDGIAVADNLTLDPKLVSAVTDAEAAAAPTLASAWINAVNGADGTAGIILSGENWFDAKVNELLVGYTLQKGSPAIDAGVKVPYWTGVAEEKRFPLTRDFFGNSIDETDPNWKPDIGLQEYSNAPEDGNWNVTFLSGDDSEPVVVPVKAGSAIGSALPADPTWEPRTFAGWNTKADGSGSAVTAETVVTAHMSVYAQWTYTYTVTFRLSAEDTNAYAVKEVKAPADTLSDLPANPTNPEGKAFSGWYTGAEGSGSEFTSATKLTGNLTVYAKWVDSSSSYIVTFYRNTGATDETIHTVLSVEKGESATVGALPSAPVWTGHTFLGWSTDRDSFTTDSQVTADTKLTGNLSVYARWAEVSYTVKFLQNDGSGDLYTTMTAKGPAYFLGTLPAAPVRAGYAFLGWNTQVDGKGEAFTATTIVSGDLEVYAQWSYAFTVTFDKNGGDTEANPKALTVADPKTTVDGLPTAPIRAGYCFTGWNTKADGTGEAFTASTAVTGDLTVYAQWVEVYTVSFAYNYPDAEAPAAVEVRWPAVTVVLPVNPSREGYLFDGWNTQADGTGDLFTGATVVTDHLTVYAQWTEVETGQIYVTFDRNGGEVDSTPSYGKVETPPGTVALPETPPTWVDHRFLGWFTEAGEEFTAETVVSESMHVYAKWSYTFTVTFDKNGGDTQASPADKTVSSPETTLDALPEAPTRSGYTFAGWNTKADGSGEAFNATSEITASLTVYAQWASIYTVTFEKNGGDTEPNPATISVIWPMTTVEQFPSSPSRSGYSFAGWYTEAVGGVAFQTSTPVTADCTVYAHWEVSSSGGNSGGSSGGGTPAPKPEVPTTNVSTSDGGTVSATENRDGSITYYFKHAEDVPVLYLRVNGLLVPAADRYTAKKGEDPSVVVIFAANAANASERFDDVAQLPDYAQSAISYVSASGLFTGMGESTFAPDAGMDRAMFATVLARLYGAKTEPYSERENTFDDVSLDSWYGPSVAWASEMGLVDGVGNGSFAPQRTLSRQELVTLVYRFAGKVEADTTAAGDLTTFQDAEQTAAWATDAMTWAIGLGLINGRGENLAPNAPVTRAEAAIILERMGTLLVKAETIHP